MSTLIRPLIATLLILGIVGPVRAAVETKAVQYKDGDVELEGYFAWDGSIHGKRPGVIVVHEWWGLNDYVQRRAEMLAKLGYVAFALDMYGKGNVTRHPEQASDWSKQISANVKQWQQRALVGLDILRKSELVDSQRLAAIGYCFGGATVMQMAYSGADLAGVVSFHGSLPLPENGQAEGIKAKILIAHGHEDPFVPAERIAKFQAALGEAGADWQMITFGDAKHGFTNPDAGDYGIDGLGYDEKADLRSWGYMQLFFDEIFARSD